jgi:hypothetical protein
MTDFLDLGANFRIFTAIPKKTQGLPWALVSGAALLPSNATKLNYRILGQKNLT